MCGIAGIFAYRTGAKLPQSALLHSMQRIMYRRGPDAGAIWLSNDKHIGFAHRRLSIIDLSAAADQPFVDEALGLTIVFNGEIYNYRALRTFLQSKDYLFTTHSDTEVLTKLYHHYGQSMLQHLRGMFSFAIYDNTHHRCFIARDHFGIKPLYFYDDGKQFSFASTVSALLENTDIPRTLSNAGLTGYYTWGHVPEPYTLFENVMMVPAGMSCTLTQARAPTWQRYCDLQQEYSSAYHGIGNQGNHREQLRAALGDSLSHHLVSDVPVGLFLSAGKDSATIAALAAEASRHTLQAMTLGFTEYQHTTRDECPLAEKIATHVGVDWQANIINQQHFTENFAQAISAMDQPSIDGINTYFISKAAHDCGFKVALSGLGADELLGGYNDFQQLPQYQRRLNYLRYAPGSKALLANITQHCLPKHFAKLAGLFSVPNKLSDLYFCKRALHMPWELDALLPPDRIYDGLASLNSAAMLAASADRMPTDFAKIHALETSWYMRNQLLRDTDWAAMAHSLEVRVPFVDIKLYRAVASMARHGAINKNLMLECPIKPLPDFVKVRAKTGFNIPVASWCSERVASVHPRKRMKAWSQVVLSQYLAKWQLVPPACD